MIRKLVELPDGTILLPLYDGREGYGQFRRMTTDQARLLRSGEHIYTLTDRPDARRVKINGAVRRWKRDADRIEIPWKYGMRDYGTFTKDDIDRGDLLQFVNSITPQQAELLIGMADALPSTDAEAMASTDTEKDN